MLVGDSDLILRHQDYWRLICMLMAFGYACAHSSHASMTFILDRIFVFEICFPSREICRRSELPLLLLGWVSLIRLLPKIVPSLPTPKCVTSEGTLHPTLSPTHTTLSHPTQEGVFLIASMSSPLNCLCTPVSATLPVKLACATSLTNPNAPTVLFQ